MEEHEMATPSFVKKFVRLALVPVLAAAVGAGIAYGQQGQQGRDNHNDQGHGNSFSKCGADWIYMCKAFSLAAEYRIFSF